MATEQVAIRFTVLSLSFLFCHEFFSPFFLHWLRSDAPVLQITQKRSKSFAGTISLLTHCSTYRLTTSSRLHVADNKAIPFLYCLSTVESPSPTIKSSFVNKNDCSIVLLVSSIVHRFVPFWRRFALFLCLSLLFFFSGPICTGA